MGRTECAFWGGGGGTEVLVHAPESPWGLTFGVALQVIVPQPVAGCAAAAAPVRFLQAVVRAAAVVHRAVGEAHLWADTGRGRRGGAVAPHAPPHYGHTLPGHAPLRPHHARPRPHYGHVAPRHTTHTGHALWPRPSRPTTPHCSHTTPSSAQPRPRPHPRSAPWRGGGLGPLPPAHALPSPCAQKRPSQPWLQSQWKPPMPSMHLPCPQHGLSHGCSLSCTAHWSPSATRGLEVSLGPPAPSLSPGQPRGPEGSGQPGL